MLDLEPSTFVDGAILPRGWHFFLLGGATRRSDLRADGFPGFGVPMPDLGLPRLMLAGRRVDYRSDLVVGSAIERRSSLAGRALKTLFNTGTVGGPPRRLNAPLATSPAQTTLDPRRPGTK